MSAGALLGLIGAWVLFQVLGGDALGRLNVSGAGTSEGTGLAGAAGNLAQGLAGTVPGPGQPMPTVQ